MSEVYLPESPPPERPQQAESEQMPAAGPEAAVEREDWGWPGYKYARLVLARLALELQRAVEVELKLELELMRPVEGATCNSSCQLIVVFV